MTRQGERTLSAPGRYAWVVFALTFGLLISDYMARQVLSAVFPLLKAEWHLSDAELGALSGVVPLMVGLLTVPLSMLADRFGRVKSLFVMAVCWSLATLISSFAADYHQLLAARLVVGVGEAAYGSVGIAVVLSVFPVRMRAVLAAAFMAGGLLGQILGVAIGGAIAQHYGWRWAFAAIALLGLAIALVYLALVREKNSTEEHSPQTQAVGGIKSLFSGTALISAYIGSGLQLYVTGAIAAWLPTYFNRYYAQPIDRAGGMAAIFLVIIGIGMLGCGLLSDRLARRGGRQEIDLAIVCPLACGLLLFLAFLLPVGMGQLAVLGLAGLLAAGTAGPSGAMVANLTPASVHGGAFAVLTLANNLLGLALGPLLTGRLADQMGLLGALRFLPVACVLSAIAFWIGRPAYRGGLQEMLPAPAVRTD